MPKAEPITVAKGNQQTVFFSPRAVSEQGGVTCQGQGWRVWWFPRTRWASLDQGLRNGCRSQVSWHRYTWMLEQGSVKASSVSLEVHGHMCYARQAVPVLGGQDHHATLNWGCVMAEPPFSRWFSSMLCPQHVTSCPGLLVVMCLGSMGLGLVRGLRFQFHTCILFRLGGSRSKNPGLGNKSYLKHLCPWLVDFGLVAMFLWACLFCKVSVVIWDLIWALKMSRRTWYISVLSWVGIWQTGLSSFHHWWGHEDAPRGAQAVATDPQAGVEVGREGAVWAGSPRTLRL